MHRSVSGLYADSILLLKAGWKPLSGFALLSIPLWWWLALRPTPDITMLFMAPLEFVTGWLLHALFMTLLLGLIAVVTITPATYFLLRIHRKSTRPISLKDLFVSALVPAMIDMSVGLSIIAVALGLALAVVQMSSGGEVVNALKIVSAMIFGMLFLIIGLIVTLAIIYPSMRWLAIASMDGGSTFTQRVSFLKKHHRELRKLLWSVTGAEQLLAFILSAIGAILAMMFSPVTSTPNGMIMQAMGTGEPLTNLLAQSPQASFMITVLSGIGWLAIWLFLPVWIVAYDVLPKPQVVTTVSKSL